VNRWNTGRDNRDYWKTPGTTRDLARVSEIFWARQIFTRGPVLISEKPVPATVQHRLTSSKIPGPDGQSTITSGVQGTGYALILKPERAITGEVLSLRQNPVSYTHLRAHET